MTKQERIQLLKMYELALKELCHFYEMGSPAVLTAAAESKVNTLKAILTVMNIPFSE